MDEPGRKKKRKTIKQPEKLTTILKEKGRMPFHKNVLGKYTHHQKGPLGKRNKKIREFWAPVNNKETPKKDKTSNPQVGGGIKERREQRAK